MASSSGLNIIVSDKYDRIQAGYFNIGSKTYPIFKGINTIGRNKDAIVNIKNLSISTQHAIITIVDDGQHYISDLNSSNGVILGSTKLTPFKLYELMEGSEIQIGGITGYYTKVKHKENTILQKKNDNFELSQNMSQNFYAANTQLMLDDDSVLHTTSHHSDEHNYSVKTPEENNDNSKVNDEATQVIASSSNSRDDQHSDLESKQVDVNKESEHKDLQVHFEAIEIVDSVQNKENLGLETEQTEVDEHHDLQVHFDKTQVMEIGNKQNENNVTNIHEALTQAISSPVKQTTPADANIDIHESPTQIFEIEHKSTENSSNDKILSDPSVHEAETQLMEVSNFLDNPPHDDDNYYDNLDPVDTSKNSASYDNAINIVNLPSTSNYNGNCSEIDDSIAKSSSSRRTTFGEVEESVYEDSLLSDSRRQSGVPPIEKDENSNDSVDFLEMAPKESQLYTNLLQKRVINRISSDSRSMDNKSEESQIHTSQLQKRVNNGIESDSDNTDIEDYEAIKKDCKGKSEEDSQIHTSQLQKRVNNRIESDSDNTDIEDCEAIKKDDKGKNTGYGVNVEDGSDTEIEEDLIQKEVSKMKESICDNSLDDSDFIPATQDDYKNEKKEESQASTVGTDASFKLGLTQMMSGMSEDKISPQEKFEFKDDIRSEELIKPSTSKIVEKLNHSDDLQNATGYSESDMEPLYLSNSEKIIDSQAGSESLIEPQKKFSFKKTSYNIVETNLSKLIDEHEIDKKDEKNESLIEDIYIQPTQNICNEPNSRNNLAEEDIYLQATQAVNNDTNKRELEQPTQDDIYLQATQHIEKSDKIVKHFEDDDVYLQPTQKLKGDENVDKDLEDSIFLKPKQPFNVSVRKTVEDVFEQSTQKLKETKPIDKDKQHPGTSNEVLEDVYLLPTQQIENVDNENINKEDGIFSNATQILENNVNIDSSCNKNDSEITNESLVTEENSVFLKSTLILENSVFDEPTQQILNTSKSSTEKQNISNESKLDSDNDVFMIPTQSIQNKTTTNEDNSITDSVENTGGQREKYYDTTQGLLKDLVSDGETSFINVESKSSSSSSKGKKKAEEITEHKFVPGLEKNKNSTKRVSNRNKSRKEEKTELEQKSSNDTCTTNINTDNEIEKNTNKYYNTTQMLLEDLVTDSSQKSETQMEAVFPSQNVKLVEIDENRPKNPLCAVLDVNTESLLDEKLPLQPEIDEVNIQPVDKIIESTGEESSASTNKKNKRLANVNNYDQDVTSGRKRAKMDTAIATSSRMSNRNKDSPKSSNKKLEKGDQEILLTKNESRSRSSKRTGIISENLKENETKKLKSDGNVKINDKAKDETDSTPDIIDEEVAQNSSKNTKTKEPSDSSSISKRNRKNISSTDTKSKRSRNVSKSREEDSDESSCSDTKRTNNKTDSNNKKGINEEEKETKSSTTTRSTRSRSVSKSRVIEQNNEEKPSKSSITRNKRISNRVEEKESENSKKRKTSDPIAKRKSRRISTDDEIVTIEEKPRRANTKAKVLDVETMESKLPVIEEISDNKPSTSRLEEVHNLTNPETVMTVVEQSFALLEAKSSKTRKVKKTVTEDLHITVSNRKSMIPADINELKPLESNLVPDRRSRKVKENVKKAKSSLESINKADMLPPPKRTRQPSRKLRESQESESSQNSAEETKKSAVSTPRALKSADDRRSSALLSTPERAKRKLKPKVVFTMLDDATLDSAIRQLGGSVVDSVDVSTVLVTSTVKRSMKLLEAVGQGKPICSQNWIKDSKKSGSFLDPADYILIDKDAEKKWNFSLKESLRRSQESKLFKDYVMQLIVNNAQDVLKGAIEACGGKCITRTPSKDMPEKFVIVSSLENKSKWLNIVKKNPNVLVIEPEAIFDACLRQEFPATREKWAVIANSYPNARILKSEGK